MGRSPKVSVGEVFFSHLEKPGKFSNIRVPEKVFVEQPLNYCWWFRNPKQPLGMYKTQENKWDIYHIKWCSISSINSMKDHFFEERIVFQSSWISGAKCEISGAKCRWNSLPSSRVFVRVHLWSLIRLKVCFRLNSLLLSILSAFPQVPNVETTRSLEKKTKQRGKFGIPKQICDLQVSKSDSCFLSCETGRFFHAVLNPSQKKTVISWVQIQADFRESVWWSTKPNSLWGNLDIKNTLDHGNPRFLHFLGLFHPYFEGLKPSFFMGTWGPRGGINRFEMLVRSLPGTLWEDSREESMNYC